MSYNGWNNYATFRIHNDILNGTAFEDTVSADDLREIVQQVVFQGKPVSRFLTDCVNLFLETVDWTELAEVYNTDILTQKLSING